MSAVPNQFEAPTELNNVVLIVEGKKLHVSKEYLASHSPVFAAMFNGNFAEKGKDEVEIKEVVYQEFVDILNLIHPGFVPIKADSVSHILKLADQFQIKDAREQAENFLMKTDNLDVQSRLKLADKYNIPQLTEKCLNSFDRNRQFFELFTDYASLSDATKVAIWNRMKLLDGYVQHRVKNIKW